MADYTQNGRIKLISTAEPLKRPTYQQWIKEFKISHAVYDIDSDAKKKATEINSKMGVTVDNRSLLQIVTGQDIENDNAMFYGFR